MIDELALIAHPQPRPGEVNPPEAFDDAAEQIAHDREDYAANLRAMCDDTGEDPLLAELRNSAGRREAAESHIKALLAYGRHFTGGARPGYSWPVLAEAAGLDRKTAERRVSEDDVAAVRDAVDASRPRAMWINPPRHDAKHDTVLVGVSQDEAALLVEVLRQAAEQGDQDRAKVLTVLAGEIDAARETPADADEHLSREATWHPANQLARLLPEALRQAVRSSGPRPVVSRSIEITAAMAHDQGGTEAADQLLQHARWALHRAANTTYPHRGPAEAPGQT